MIITESEMYFWKNETKEDITSFFDNILSNIHQDNQVLYFSFSYTKKELINQYKNFNQNNITIINNPTLSINDMKKYIEKYKTNYVMIDYFTSIRNKRHMYINGNKLKYVNEKLEEYETTYSIKILVVVNWIDL